MAIIKIEKLSFSYDGLNYIYKDCNITFEKGKIYAVTGPSGCGKTTMMYLLSALIKNYEGNIYIEEKNIKEINENELRRSVVSLVFQNYNLIPHLNAIQNIMLINEKSLNENDAIKILDKVGLNGKTIYQKTASLSGGEKQRVAIARAFASRNKIIIADEPTGNLDVESSNMIIPLFRKLAVDIECCIIIITHNYDIAKMCDRILKVENKVIYDISNLK